MTVTKTTTVELKNTVHLILMTVYEQGRGRTYDLLIRSQAPYPFGHMPLSCLTRRVWGFPASTPEKGTTAHNALIEQMSGLNFSVVSRE